MGHDNAADKTGRNTPGSRIGIFRLTLIVDKGNISRFGKILPQKMRCSGLQGFTVLHHGFHAVGINGSGEFFMFRLAADQHRHCQRVFAQIAISLQHALGFLFGFGGVGMSRMPFLPKELARSQKQAGTHFPTYHVGPLVNQHRQVAVRLNPFGKRVGNNRF